MVWIQSTLIIYLGHFLRAWLILASFNAYSQQEKLVLNLKQENSHLFRHQQYYIQEVEDKRKSPGTAIGRVIIFGKETPMFLPKTAERELLNYWVNTIPKGDQAYLPLYITVKDLQLVEKRIAPNKVNGEAKLQVSFR